MKHQNAKPTTYDHALKKCEPYQSYESVTMEALRKIAEIAILTLSYLGYNNFPHGLSRKGIEAIEGLSVNYETLTVTLNGETYELHHKVFVRECCGECPLQKCCKTYKIDICSVFPGYPDNIFRRKIQSAKMVLPLPLLPLHNQEMHHTVCRSRQGRPFSTFGAAEPTSPIRL